MRAFLFPGQGAQRAGMGVDLLDRYAEHREIADRVLGYSIIDVCAGRRAEALRRTEYVQPALFVVEVLSYLAHTETDPAPAVLAGHSVGEFAALWAAGCFEFETGVRLVRERGRLMGQADGGGMAAVIGLTDVALTALLDEHGADDVDVANHNAPDQIVLSGPRPSLDALVGVVRARGGRYVPLNVSAAFHSRYMRAAADEFAAMLSDVDWRPPRIPVIANVTAEPYPAAGMARLLAQQITAPVRWRESMRHMATAGVREVVEVGPGDVLTKLWAACAVDRATPPARQPPRPAPPTEAPAPAPIGRRAISAYELGCASFREAYGLRYAYLAGSMFRGISSTDLVTRMANAGLMGFFGTGGLPVAEVAAAIDRLEAALGQHGRFGLNLMPDLRHPEREEALVDLFLDRDVRCVEAAAYTTITPAMVRLRLRGAYRDGRGRPVSPRRVIAKVSRPEVAQAFMRPPPPNIVAKLLAAGRLTEREASIAAELSVCEDICVEADSAGHTDGGVAFTLIPTFARLRDEIVREYGRAVDIRVGASGGLGAPEAVAAAFVLGADFVMTGSVNQCTVEAGTSRLVKEMLSDVDVQDTTYAPAGDMFELGARVQVMRKGTLFAARANKLYQLYRTFDSIESIDARTRGSVSESCFGRPLEEVWLQVRQHRLDRGHLDEISRADASGKHRMALVFRQYFIDSTMTALAGTTANKVNFQIHCGPAMGAFNRFAAESPLRDWSDRHPDAIAEALMSGAATVLTGLTASP